MTSQEIANEILAEHQAARMRLAVTRSEALYNYWLEERRSGVDSLTAHERMVEHAKYLDRTESVS